MQIGMSMSIPSVVRTLPMAVRSILAKYPAGDAHLYLPAAQTPILGPEKVINGDFSVDANWTKPAGFSITGGQLVASAVSTGAGSNQTIAFTAGAVYAVTYTISGYVSGALQAYLFGGTSVAGAIRSSNGTFTEYLTSAAGGNTTLRLYVQTTFTGNIDNVSVKEVTGYSSRISGFDSGNYLDSAGTTVATVDNPVGLVLDGAGSVGSECYPNGLAGAALSGGATLSGAVATLPAGLTQVLASGFTSTPNMTYRITVDVVSNTGALLNAYIGASAIFGFVSGAFVGKKTFFIKANTGNDLILQNDNGSTGSATVSLVECKPVTGIHASQATAGFKPVERRGIVNLLTYSQQVMPTFGGWNGGAVGTINSATAPDGTLTASKVTTTSDWIWKDIDGPVGTYTFAIYLRAATGTSFQTGLIFNEKASGTRRASQLITVTDTWTLFAISGTTSTGAGIGRVEISNGLGGVNLPIGSEIYRAGIFQGTLTASQILSFGGIPITTTAAASSSGGNYFWQFDGVDDVIPCSTEIDLSNSAYALFVAVKASSSFGTDRLLVGGSGSTSNSNPHIAIRTTGALGFDQYGNALNSSAGAVSVNENFVVSGLRRTTGRKLRKNGVEVASDANTTLLTSSTGFALGGNLAANRCASGIYGAVVIKGDVSDADATTIDNWLKTLAGV